MTTDVYFRALEYDDLDFINQLRNDNTLFQYTTGNKYFISQEYDKKWIEDKIFNNRDQLYVMICAKKDNQRIGYIGVTDIDYINRKALLNSIIIHKDHSKKGYGMQVNVLMLRHLFLELNMNMLYSYVRTDHPSSVKILSKLGFCIDGTIRSFVYKQNKYHDVYILSLLKEDYARLQLDTV